MMMADNVDLIWSEDGDVVVEIAKFTSSTPEYMPLGCPIGDVTIPRSRETRTREREGWCSTNQAGLAQAIAGKLTITPSMTLEMVPADPAYAILNDAINGVDDGQVFLRFTATNKAVTPASHTLEYLALMTQNDITFSGSGASRTPVGFHVNEIIADTIDDGQ